MKRLLLLLILSLFALSCTAEVTTEENVASQEQALCTVPTSTAFHTIVGQQWNISVTEECAEAHPDEFLAYYETSEPRRWRLDVNAPTPKRPGGQSCGWMYLPTVSTNGTGCAMHRGFVCRYLTSPPGILYYYVDYYSNSNNWSNPYMVMTIEDPSGNVWSGCTRTFQSNFPLE